MPCPLRVLRSRWRAVAVAILACFVFFMGALVSGQVFERLPHLEDEVAYLFQARVFAGGALAVDMPKDARSFWQPFVVDHEPSGKRFGKYPPGWPALLAIGVVSGYEWCVNAVFGALTVVLVFCIGREAYGRDVGLIAAGLTAFSPAALLLNGTLMAHSAALFFATLFMWAFLRAERELCPPGFAVATGGALGVLFAIRPLSAFAVGLPFLVWGAVRCAAGRREWRGRSRRSPLRSVLLGAAVALVVAGTVPSFNYAVTGNVRTDLYDLVWPYDSIGFGAGHGRTGHTLTKGLRHAHFDLSLAAADLFGWQIEPITPDLVEVLRSGAGSWPATGLSFVLLPIGAALGLLARRRGRADVALRLKLVAIWVTGAGCWLLLPRLVRWAGTSHRVLDSPSFGWLWIAVAVVWLLLPLTALRRWREVPEVPHTWLFVAVALGTVIVHMAYWTGSQRYSTRYYFEALTAVALLSAVPIARLASGRWRSMAYAAAIGVSVVGFARYSMPRLAALEGFNGITGDLIREVEARRLDDRDVLVLVACDGQARWQWYGSLMAATSPFLDGVLVVARDFSDGSGERISKSFGDRQVLRVHVSETGWYFLPEGSLEPSSP